MATMITDTLLEDRLIADRKARGIDRHDEVWEGVYMMTPAPNDEHQQIATRLARVFVEMIEDAELGQARSGVNLASTVDDWTSDYRVPDAAVFLDGSSAKCHGTFWHGASDFVVEIVSPDDRTREKIAFYEKIGARELLIIDRDPWQLELFRLQDGKLISVGICTPDDSRELSSDGIPLAVALIGSVTRPEILVRHTKSSRVWVV